MRNLASTALTHHARERIDRRGVCPEALGVLLVYGDDLPAGRGCVRRTLRLDRVSEACADGVPIAAAETALRIEAVVGPNEEIVTCWRRAPWSLARERRSRTRHRGRRA